MKLFTFLTRLLPLGLLGCCLPAAVSTAPGGSQWGFRKIFVSRFSQAIITKSKKPSDQHARQANASPQRWVILTRKSLADFAAN